MAVASEQNDTVSVQNSAEIVFVDEDDFPLANLMEHVQSDDDLDDDLELVQDEEEAETPIRRLPVPRGRRNENINLRPDLDFDQPTGPRIELEEDMKPVDFFQLYFTDALWNHIVDQTNLYAEQKRGPEERSVWYALTVNEFKAWIALTLNMGIVKKPSLRLYWSTDEIFKTPFFSAGMSRDRQLFSREIKEMSAKQGLLKDHCLKITSDTSEPLLCWPDDGCLECIAANHAMELNHFCAAGKEAKITTNIQYSQ